MKKYMIYIAVLSLTLLASCEKYLLGPDPENTPVSNFEYLWQEADHKYSYFEYKSIDWDSVYSVFRPQVHNEMSDHALFDVLAEMLNVLEDGHVNLQSDFDRSRNWDWMLDYPKNFNRTIISRNYLGEDYRITGPLLNQVIDSVLYVYYGSFASTISQANLNELMQRAQGLRGVIIDIRSNGGGSSYNAFRLAACFTDSSYNFARDRVKMGPGSNDFSPWTTMTVTPRSGQRFSGPLILLCNRGVYSAANYFTQMMKANPRATLIGDHTGGGGGVPAYGELPNGWIYRFSSTQAVNMEGEHIENGIEVDVRKDLHPLDEALGIDTILEYALDYLRADS